MRRSKIDGSDLLNIQSFGFRGEALPSLGAVGRLKIVSRVAGGEAHEIRVTGGEVSAVRPAALSRGTVVELRDLFYAHARASEIHAHGTAPRCRRFPTWSNGWPWPSRGIGWASLSRT